MLKKHVRKQSQRFFGGGEKQQVSLIKQRLRDTQSLSKIIKLWIQD